MAGLVWSRLQTMKCPKCNMALKEAITSSIYRCDGVEEGSCDFVISKEKFNALVQSLYRPKKARIITEEENLSELNNL